MLFANALPLLQIMSMDIALAPPPSPSLASRWAPRGHGLPAEALADRPSARPSPLLAWRSHCLCPTLKVCACLPDSHPSLTFPLPLPPSQQVHAMLPPWGKWIKSWCINKDKCMLMRVSSVKTYSQWTWKFNVNIINECLLKLFNKESSYCN